jgi:hypothetical protein
MKTTTLNILKQNPNSNIKKSNPTKILNKSIEKLIKEKIIDDHEIDISKPTVEGNIQSSKNIANFMSVHTEFTNFEPNSKGNLNKSRNFSIDYGNASKLSQQNLSRYKENKSVKEYVETKINKNPQYNVLLTGDLICKGENFNSNNSKILDPIRNNNFLDQIKSEIKSKINSNKNVSIVTKPQKGVNINPTNSNFKGGDKLLTEINTTNNQQREPNLSYLVNNNEFQTNEIINMQNEEEENYENKEEAVIIEEPIKNEDLNEIVEKIIEKSASHNEEEDQALLKEKEVLDLVKLTSEIPNSEENTSFFPQKTFEKMELIKSTLIEVVNETKDKYLIIRELDQIYRNILKVAHPKREVDNNLYISPSPVPNTNVSQNLHYLTNMEDDNIFNFTNCFVENNNNFTSSQSKPSLHYRDASNIGESLQIENEFLKNENHNLKHKIDEIDKKFERISQENENLKGYVLKKTDNVDAMQEIIMKFQSELNEIKKERAQVVVTNVNNVQNRQNINMNSHTFSGSGGFNMGVGRKSKSPGKFSNTNINAAAKVQNLLAEKILKKTFPQTQTPLIKKHQKQKKMIQNNTSLPHDQFEEDNEYLNTSISFDNVEDAKNLLHLPKKVNPQIQKIDLPKLNIANVNIHIKPLNKIV